MSVLRNGAMTVNGSGAAAAWWRMSGAQEAFSGITTGCTVSAAACRCCQRCRLLPNGS